MLRGNGISNLKQKCINSGSHLMRRPLQCELSVGDFTCLLSF